MPGDRPVRYAATIVACLSVLPAAGAALAAGVAVDAVTTPGSATLTKCRDWLVYSSCSTYHRIALPERVAVGDKFKLKYGSNPKVFMFDVSGIRRDGERCIILSTGGGAEAGERLEVAPCLPAAEPAGEAR